MDDRRFEEIMDEVEDLLREARDIAAAAPGMTGERAELYWYRNIVSCIRNDTGILGGCMCSMEDTLAELRGERD